MAKVHNPSTVAKPVGAYSNAIEVPAGARWLYIAGQIGIKPDGSVPDHFADQAHQAWRNVVALLDAAGMGVENLVHVNHWLTEQAQYEIYADIRAQYLGDARPAATLVVVRDLVKPGFLVEVGAVAAKVD